jgi:hypothetical protein
MNPRPLGYEPNDASLRRLARLMHGVRSSPRSGIPWAPYRALPSASATRIIPISR